MFYLFCVKPSRKKAKARKVRQNRKARKAKTNKAKAHTGASTAVQAQPCPVSRTTTTISDTELTEKSRRPTTIS